MHYFFLDESYPPPPPGQKKIWMAAWAVEQHRWRNETARRFDLFKPPMLKRICSMFETLDASALVATAVLDESVFRVGETDATNDIPSMARPDLIWSMSATFVLGTLILQLMIRNREIGTLDIHFDPKSLTTAHSESWKSTLRQLVVKQAKQFATERRFRTNLKKLKVRRVEPVTKADHLGGDREKFLMGTWVSDKLCKLCSRVDDIESFKECSRIFGLDMSEGVRRTTQQFDGKSFYES
jgi:hypothetical protein